MRVDVRCRKGRGVCLEELGEVRLLCRGRGKGARGAREWMSTGMRGRVGVWGVDERIFRASSDA